MTANSGNGGSETSHHTNSNPELDEFYTRAYSRIFRFMLISSILAAPILLWRAGLQFTLGFVFGCAIAFVNFHWLKQTIAGLSELVLATPEKTSAGRVVRRFLLRYFLIGVGAYVILKVSDIAVYGLFTGLLLPVAGIFVEAVYELRTSFRQTP